MTVFTESFPWDPAGERRYNEHKRREVYQLEQYRTDGVVLRSWTPSAAIEADRSPRGDIGAAPSRKSLQRLVFVLNNCDTPMASMLTLTMTPQVNAAHSVEEHRQSIKAVLQRLRRDGVGQYCWVREFQRNEGVHWHVFTDLHVGDAGEINPILSGDWSHWWAKYFRKKNASVESYRKMIHGDGRGFQCCRFEQLRTDAGGRYAGKEGAKRFQKVPPKRWRQNGGAWWRASRGITCTPIRTVAVAADSLEWVQFKLPDGSTLETPLKVQFSKGSHE